jgi:hypothetical protein
MVFLPQLKINAPSFFTTDTLNLQSDILKFKNKTNIWAIFLPEKNTSKVKLL